MARAKSAFGTICKKGARPGYYLRFQMNGRRKWRYAGRTRGIAEGNRNTLQGLLEKGV